MKSIRPEVNKSYLLEAFPDMPISQAEWIMEVLCGGKFASKTTAQDGRDAPEPSPEPVADEELRQRLPLQTALEIPSSASADVAKAERDRFIQAQLKYMKFLQQSLLVDISKADGDPATLAASSDIAFHRECGITSSPIGPRKYLGASQVLRATLEA